eukprot:3735601-Pyramimonas_sp.AAC.1
MIEHFITTLKVFQRVSNPFNLIPESAMVCLIERLLHASEHDGGNEYAVEWWLVDEWNADLPLSLIHISEPTRPEPI